MNSVAVAGGFTHEGPIIATIEFLATLLGNNKHFSPDLLLRPHPLFLTVTRNDHIVVIAPAVIWDRWRDLFKPFASRLASGTTGIILIGQHAEDDVDQALNRGILGVVSANPSAFELEIALRRAFELLDAKTRAESRGQWLRRYRYELGELIDIARAMTTERDVNKLLGVILEKSRFVTGADAGSIYVVEGDESRPTLRFKLSQNESVSFDSREFVMPLSTRSIAGSAAIGKRMINIADVYELGADSPFGFDPSFDQKIGYITRSMLVAPLISQRDEVIGVIQLINKKKDPDRKLFSKQDALDQVIPFDQRSEELLGMVAAQAGASLENALLYDEIRRLFEGFVRASVEAIESRDPTTSGHSRRVADLTVGLAKVVDRETVGPYKDAFFSGGDLRELEYASLLHDFGKIGVREKVLVKAKKLFEDDLILIRSRFDFITKSLEAEILARKVRGLERGASTAELEALDRELVERRAELDAAYEAILSANEPTVMSAGDFGKIEKLAKDTFLDLRGQPCPLLREDEVISLSIKKGSLTPTEFDEIRSHVSHTYRFLSQIPWGKAFRRVPIIAGAHHERLNGTGYPNRLRAEEIPVQSKMMSVADIYDALTASDRPYKKAVPVERALDILEYAVKDGHLDADLVRIFREARVWDNSAKTV